MHLDTFGAGVTLQVAVTLQMISEELSVTLPNMCKGVR
jgi:hypothetical protein